MKQVKQVQPTAAWLSLLLTVLIALGLAGTLAVLGGWLGSQTTAQGENGWFDMREAPRFFAMLFLGCGGLIVGLVGGGFLGRWLSQSNPAIAGVVAFILVAIPLTFTATARAKQAAVVQLATESRIRREEVDRQRGIQYAAERAVYLNSAQYAELVQKQTSRLETFRTSLGPLVYPNSHYVGSLVPVEVRYETSDPYASVETYMLSHSIRGAVQGPEKRLCYFDFSGYRGLITIERQTGSGVTSIQYDLDP